MLYKDVICVAQHTVNVVDQKLMLYVSVSSEC